MTFEQWWEKEGSELNDRLDYDKGIVELAWHKAIDVCRNDKDITVIQPGAQASMGGIKVSILSVTIGYSGHVTYTVSWLDGNTRHVATVEEHELVCTSDKAHDNLRIGFNNG